MATSTAARDDRIELRTADGALAVTLSRRPTE